MRTAGMVVLLLQSCPTPVAISCRPTRTEGPRRSGPCGTAWCRETMRRPGPTWLSTWLPIASTACAALGNTRRSVTRVASDEASENPWDLARLERATPLASCSGNQLTNARNLILERINRGSSLIDSTSAGVSLRPCAAKFQAVQIRASPVSTRCRAASVPLDSE
jgi:hypothetical protein